MSELHMFTADDEEWVIAADPADAARVYCDHLGNVEPDMGDPDKADGGTHAVHWKQVPDEKEMRLRTECERAHRRDEPCLVEGCKRGVIVRAKTARAWVEECGRGHWASANV